MASTTTVAIIGAGPYGLSVAAHLRARGVAFRIFGGPMYAWRQQMPKGMFLKSEGFASSFSDPEHRHTLPAFCADRGIDSTAPISLKVFTDYGLWFQQQLVPELEEVDVVQLDRTGREFELLLSSGDRLTAGHVVLGVGIGHFAYVPGTLAHLPPRLVSHTSDHHDLQQFSGRDVTVLGGGQSALETAALLHEQGAMVRILLRTSELRFHLPPPARQRTMASRLRTPTAGLGLGWPNWFLEHIPTGVHYLPATTRVRLVHQILGPCGAWWLKDRVVGRFEAMTGYTILQATAEGEHVRLLVHQQEGRWAELVTSHIVAGTGYHVNLKRLQFLSPGLLSQLRDLDGSPVLSRHFESSVPGLYFAGLAAAYSFGPLLRFVLGVHATAPAIAQHIARTAKSGARHERGQASALARTA
jgi:cation diffusion facilitator CzcD-associated flavoprotein CzcO